MTVDSLPSVEDADLCRAHAAAWLLLAWGFHYPDHTLLENLQDPCTWTRWPDSLGEGRAAIVEKLGRLREFAERQTGLGFIEARYVALFGHTARGACPLYELEYGKSEVIQQAAHMADLAGFYRAFGLEPAESGYERLDHLAVECEFLAVLAVKEAHAIEAGNTEMLSILRHAQKKFLQEHLGRWLPALSPHIRQRDADGMYGRLADLATAVLDAVCRRFRIATAPPLMTLSPERPLEAMELTCDVEASCPDAADPSFVSLHLDPALGQDRSKS